MNWMTVRDVAEYLQLSEMMVYKLAQTGRLPAVKIGRVWRFEKESIDQWIKSTKPTALRTASDTTIDNFVQRLKETFGENISHVIIFGSQARGEAKEDSDIDVLVVLKAIDNYWQSHAMVGNIAYDVTFGSGRQVVLSPILIDEKEYLTGLSPLLLNIRKEGKIAA